MRRLEKQSSRRTNSREPGHQYAYGMLRQNLSRGERVPIVSLMVLLLRPEATQPTISQLCVVVGDLRTCAKQRFIDVESGEFSWF